MENLEPIAENSGEAESTSMTTTGGLWRLAFRRLIRNRSSQVGIFLASVLILIAVFAKQIAPYDPA